MISTILLGALLSGSDSSQTHPFTIEIHPVGLLATGLFLGSALVSEDENSSSETRLTLLEADLAWRFAPTSSLVASLSTYPTFHSEVEHFLEDGERIGRSTHGVTSLGLDVGIRRHRADRKGLCLDLLAGFTHRTYDATATLWETRRTYRESQWTVGFLGKPGFQWSWNRISLRAGIGVGLEWASSAKDSTLFSLTTEKTLQDGSTRSSTMEIGAMDELPVATEKIQRQVELDLALGMRF